MSPAEGPPIPLIRRAVEADAGCLSALAMRSKAVWGYDAAFLEACRFELTITRDAIAGLPTYLLDERGVAVGFYQLRPSAAAVAEVAQFFIAPERLRGGLGRRLWAHLEERARELGYGHLEVEADPNALPFYLAMGMARDGDAPSGSIPGRLLPRLIKQLQPARGR